MAGDDGEDADMIDPRGILEDSSTVAVVGCSTDPGTAAHEIPRQLQEARFRIVPVNPNATEVLDERAYPTLADVPRFRIMKPPPA